MTQNGSLHQYVSELTLDSGPCPTCGNYTVVRCIRRELVPQRLVTIAGQPGGQYDRKVVNSWGRCIVCGRGELHEMDQQRRPKLMVSTEDWGSLVLLPGATEIPKRGDHHG